MATPRDLSVTLGIDSAATSSLFQASPLQEQQQESSPTEATEAQKKSTAKTTLDLLLDQAPSAYEFFLQKIFDTLKSEELGEFLHALVRRNQYDEIVRMFIRRPDIAVNYSDMQGNTALHLALSNETIDFSLVNFLCEKGGSLTVKNARSRTPLQLCFTTQANSVEMIKLLLTEWHLTVSSEAMQEVFLESAYRQWDDLSIYLLESFGAQLNVHGVVSAITGNKAIHQAVLSQPMDLYLLGLLIGKGATLQCTNAEAQTPLDLLLQAKAYDKITLLVKHFPDAFSVAQLTQVFAHLIQDNRYDIYGQLLLMLAQRSDKDFLVESLVNAVRHLNLSTVTTFIRLLQEKQPGDLSLLKYIDLAMGAEIKDKKMAANGIIRGMLKNIYSSAEIVKFIAELEAETHLIGYPNLGFLRERKAASLYGHTWHGEAACGTWVRFVEDAQRRIVELAKNEVHFVKQPQVEGFLGERTRERHFSMFTRHPERRFLDRYTQAHANHEKALETGVHVPALMV
jgi:ankyrin repeat protein